MASVRTWGLWLFLAVPCAGATITVNQDGSADYMTIQPAIDAAQDGDTVIIAPGTYRGDGNQDILIRDKSIVVQSTDPDDPDIVAATVIQAGPAEAQEHCGFRFVDDQSKRSVLQGLSITGSTWGFYSRMTGGILIENSRPLVRKCRIYGNARGIAGNYAPGNSSEILIVDCLIEANNGYGVALHNAGLTIKRCRMDNNNSAGLLLHDDARDDLVLEDCSFSWNRRWGMYLESHFGARTFIRRCRIVGNELSSQGGAIMHRHSFVQIENCVIACNICRGYGGGIYSQADLVVKNCTITANRAGLGAGGIYLAGETEAVAQISNSIIRGNQHYELFVGANRSVSVRFCNMGGGEASVEVTDGAHLEWGPGNDDIEPDFFRPGYWHDNGTPSDETDDFAVDGDYHLKSARGRWDPALKRWVQDDLTSRCIDAGDPADGWCGELWPHGQRVNAGAYGNTNQASMSGSDAGDIADLNCDGHVGTADFGLFAACWRLDALSAAAPYAADLDRDGAVGLADLARLTEAFTRR